MRWLVCFDIAENRRRSRVVKHLLSCAYRVQESVFEGIFSAEAMMELKAKVVKVIDPKLDSVRYYPLCAGCEKKIEINGIGKKIEETGYVII